MVNWDALSAIAEMVGALAVVATLGYLAAQIRTNTAAVNHASRQATLLGRAESGRWLASDPDVGELLFRGFDDPGQLSDLEWRRFLLVAQSILRTFELAFIDFEEGRITADFWKPQEHTLLYWCAQPGFRKVLSRFRGTLYPGFTCYLERLVLSIDADDAEMKPPDLLHRD